MEEFIAVQIYCYFLAVFARCGWAVADMWSATINKLCRH